MTSTLVLIANAGDATVSAFELDAAASPASLRYLASNALPAPSSTFAVDAEALRVYAGVKATEEEPNRILTLALDPSTGELTQESEVEVDASVTYLALSPDRKSLLGASYGGGVGHVWPVTDGVVGTPTASVEFPNLHCVVTSSDGCAYFVSLGADLVAQYRLGGGLLTPLDPPTVELPQGSGPRHLILNAAEDAAYLMTEFTGKAFRLARASDGTLTVEEEVAAYDTDAGLRQSVFGADPVEGHLVWGADLHFARDERFLVCSERTESTLATVALGEDGSFRGVLALAETEKQPRGFGVAPDGVHLVAVGEGSTQASLYAVGDDGVLEQEGRVRTGAGANWVRFVEVG